jgi:hypothetical protein
MSFIDEALQNSTSGEDFVQAMADIYSHPEVNLADYPEWIRNIITIIDCDSNLSMEGLDFKSYEEEIKALRSASLDDEADLLANLSEDSTDDDLEKCYSQLALNNDYDAFWDVVFNYAGSNLGIR